MKKILTVMVACLFCVTAMSAQDYKIERTEKEMILPDGAVADVSFFKKWGDASKMNKVVTKQIKAEGKQNVGVKQEETDAYLGYGNIIHKESENEYVKKICEVMRECGATYGVAYADFGERSRSYVFTYFPKGEMRNSPVPELRNAFFDYFQAGQEFLVAYKNNDTTKQDRLSRINAVQMENSLLAFLREQKGQESEEFKRELQRARLKKESAARYPNSFLIESVTIHFIYSDEGYCYTSNSPKLVVDEYGGFRTYDYDYNTCEIVPTESVPKEVQDAAQKSLKE